MSYVLHCSAVFILLKFEVEACDYLSDWTPVSTVIK